MDQFWTRTKNKYCNKESQMHSVVSSTYKSYAHTELESIMCTIVLCLKNNAYFLI